MRSLVIWRALILSHLCLVPILLNLATLCSQLILTLHLLDESRLQVIWLLGLMIDLCWSWLHSWWLVLHSMVWLSTSLLCWHVLIDFLIPWLRWISLSILACWVALLVGCEWAVCLRWVLVLHVMLAHRCLLLY